MKGASRNSAFGRTALGWVNDADTGIGGRPAGAARGPDIEIVDRINDPAAEPAINRAGAVAAMLLERAWRETEMGRGIRCSQVARRNDRNGGVHGRSEEHTSELQSLMRISYAVFCLKKKTTTNTKHER